MPYYEERREILLRILEIIMSYNEVFPRIIIWVSPRFPQTSNMGKPYISLTKWGKWAEFKYEKYLQRGVLKDEA